MIYALSVVIKIDQIPCPIFFVPESHGLVIFAVDDYDNFLNVGYPTFIAQEADDVIHSRVRPIVLLDQVSD
jgi:hypothetical protein